MIICVAGKNDIAVEVTKYLFENQKNRYELVVVCNKSENGINTWQRSLRKFANDKKIRECKLEELYEYKELIFLSMEFDKIVKPERFKTDKLYNIHFSLLPQYKGMYTSAIPILNGEKWVGVTLHKIDAGIDTGEIITQKRIRLSKEETSRDLYMQYITNGMELVKDNLEKIIDDHVKTYKQESCNSTYYSKQALDYSNIKIDLNTTAEMIRRQIKAFAFREYQLPNIFGKQIIDVKVTDIKSREKPGKTIYEDDCSIMVSTIDYNVVLYVDQFDELLEACRNGRLDKVKAICAAERHIKEKNQYGWTPLIIATYNNHIDIVKYLISQGANIYEKNNNGTNLLMYAKDAYLKYDDDSLFRLYYALGLSPYEKDWNEKDLLYYINENKVDPMHKEHLLQIIGN